MFSTKITAPRAGTHLVVPALVLLTGLALLPRLGSFFEISTALIAWPWQFDYTEGVNLNATVRLAGGENIYQPNGTETFLSAPYPPLFYLLTAPFAWIAGPSFGAGRAISLLATLAVGGLLAYIVGRVTARWAAGVLIGLLWLTLSPVIVWAAHFKQDMPALAFALAGVAWVLTYPTGRRFYGGAVWFALAFYTKQSAIDAAAATVLWLLIRDWRTGLRFTLVLGGLVAVPFLALDRLFAGGFGEHLVGNHALPWSERRFGRTLNRLLDEYWPLLMAGGAALLGVGLGIARRGTRLRDGETRRAALSSPWSLAALYLGGATVTTLTRIGYEGANYNHLLDGLAPLCLLLGLALGRLWRQAEERGSQGRAGALGGLLALGILGAAQLTAFQDPHTWYRGAWPSPAIDTQMRTLSRLIASHPGDIYSEDAYLILSNGRRVLYDDPSTFVPLANLEKWDDGVLNQSLRDRRFALILLQRGSGRWTPEGLATLHDNYTLQFPDFIDTYVPKMIPNQPQYGLACTLAENDQSVALEGYSLSPGVTWRGILPGETLRATFHWRAQQRLRHNYASFLHLVNAQGERVAGQDNPATGAPQPPTAWEPGRVITDIAAIPIPPDLPPGRYQLVAGMYRLDGGTIHPLAAQCDQSKHTYGPAIAAGWIEVKDR